MAPFATTVFFAYSFLFIDKKHWRKGFTSTIHRLKKFYPRYKGIKYREVGNNENSRYLSEVIWIIWIFSWTCLEPLNSSARVWVLPFSFIHTPFLRVLPCRFIEDFSFGNPMRQCFFWDTNPCHLYSAFSHKVLQGSSCISSAVLWAL